MPCSDRRFLVRIVAAVLLGFGVLYLGGHLKVMLFKQAVELELQSNGPDQQQPSGKR